MFIAIPVNPEGGKDSPSYYHLNIAYSRYIANAGFVPVLATYEHDTIALAQRCDGLLLPGGRDIDPIFYGEDNDNSYNVDPMKDDFERRLLFAFADAGKPIFGICRGFQLIFLEYCRAFRKMTNNRFQYAQHVGEHNQTASNLAGRPTPSHMVNVMRYLLYGDENKDVNGTIMPVNSMHHQAVLVRVSNDRSIEITRHLTLLAWTTRGAGTYKGHVVAEAFSIRDWLPTRITAVQWHPEELNDVALLQHAFRKKEAIIASTLASPGV